MPVSVCGPARDPVPGWEEEIARLCGRFGDPSWPPLDVLGGEGGGDPEGVASFAWGVFREPVVSVREQRFVLSDGFSGPRERDGWLDAQTFELLAEYGIRSAYSYTHVTTASRGGRWASTPTGTRSHAPETSIDRRGCPTPQAS